MTRGRGGPARTHPRGASRGASRGPPEVAFASYQLSDAQKRRIDTFVLQSAEMFMIQACSDAVAAFPPPVAQADARGMILGHWWQSLCATRAGQGLCTDVAASALMYRTYCYGMAVELPELALVCAVCDPAAELPDGWDATLGALFQHLPMPVAELRRAVLEGAAQPEPQPSEPSGAAQPEKPKAPKIAAPQPIRPAVSGPSWADEMEEDDAE
jgi:hypothetical protein